ncbi:T9SS type A sorting domain-containing protein [Pontibacter sp. G13]|uniref:T9SS type A sorting domain-containing protein n=1 Tax=Pontibacter sp. G13 TaxID=3074898 RepID=UPI00288A0497|nr:T9SS type A sorting domain-containing protein [Pontibacter sp. G13]WNJ20880.1 T9SS type A sorting domain-containing protein [Pontibacter sp. G13]
MKKLSLYSVLMLSVLGLQAQVDITLQVDMSNEIVSSDGVHIAGNFNGWSTDATPMADQGNGIYAATLSVDPGNDVEYKFLNGNTWGAEEAAPAACTIGGSNRIFTVPAANDTLEIVPFNGCPEVVATKHVIFSVNMADQTVDANGVHIAGNFQGWSPDASQLTQVNDSIYQFEQDVLASILTIQFKFINGNAWGGDEIAPQPCGMDNGNRFWTLDTDTVNLPTYYFGSCEETLETSTSLSKQFVPSIFIVSPSPAHQQATLRLEAAGMNEARITVLNLQGQTVWEQAFAQVGESLTQNWDVSNWSTGIYLVRVESAKGVSINRFAVSK